MILGCHCCCCSCCFGCHYLKLHLIVITVVDFVIVVDVVVIVVVLLANVWYHTWLLLLLMLSLLSLLLLFWFPLFDIIPTKLYPAIIIERKPKVLNPPPEWLDKVLNLEKWKSYNFILFSDPTSCCIHAFWVLICWKEDDSWVRLLLDYFCSLCLDCELWIVEIALRIRIKDQGSGSCWIFLPALSGLWVMDCGL